VAYYDALIAKYAQAPAGTTQQKLDWVNAQVVTGAAIPMKVPYSEVYNRLVRAEYAALAAADQQSVQRILAQQTIDFGPSSAARTQMLVLFPSGKVSYTNLQTYIGQFDAPKIPWPTATLAQGGGGLSTMVNMNDLKAAGIIP
jgi:hypothetical protein